MSTEKEVLCQGLVLSYSGINSKQKFHVVPFDFMTSGCGSSYIHKHHAADRETGRHVTLIQ